VSSQLLWCLVDYINTIFEIIKITVKPIFQLRLCCGEKSKLNNMGSTLAGITHV